MLHVCRDFLSVGNPINLLAPRLVQYYVAIFARACLGYTTVGQTNFDIEGSTLRKGGGTNGSLNQGAGNEYAFQPDSYTVSVSDIGRILALKSSGNPMVNSGLFKVTGIDVNNNWLFIDYRSGDLPPVESGITWSLYASATAFNSLVNLTGNGLTGTYTGWGAATQSRIILQSPSSLGWQVRIALENSYDVNVAFSAGGTVTPSDSTTYGATIAPGFDGNSAGDFSPGGQHLHTILFHNNRDDAYLGTTCGLFPRSSNQVRFYAWGDDSTGTVFAIARNVVGGTDSMVHFGLPENEEQPLPPRGAQRLFVMGANSTGNNGILWSSSAAAGGTNSSGRGGVSFGLSNQPISCAYSLYNRLSGGGFSGAGAWKQSTAGDNPYISSTELLPVDLVAGTIVSQNGSGLTNVQVQQLEGRRLGQAPFVRMGRSNYGYFQIATAGNQLWIHLNDGIYLPWQGNILP